MDISNTNSNYIEWLSRLKLKIKKAQLKAAISVNSEMILLYWDLGKDLQQKLDEKGWGNAIVDTLSRDLKHEFPMIKGFSRRNLFYMKRFYLFYKSNFEKVQQLVAQIPWGHNMLVISKSKTFDEAEYALRGMSQPIGIAEYKLSKAVPTEVESDLPSIAEIEQAIDKFNDRDNE